MLLVMQMAVVNIEEFEQLAAAMTAHCQSAAGLAELVCRLLASAARAVVKASPASAFTCSELT